ncbi:MAG: fibro-slime domain-containing protein [Nannocystis sp.]|uniref:fibro-slime domain-containing protein n=1 Tax=Nannocystis sp. TaxID=1962667 RepID=UPI002420C1B4|nr:fibro-slime domain-containing protein [Nannocystis sp.]MBK9757095.1 fibro-slime domain-containing protein [Nannocystis sp.]
MLCSPLVAHSCLVAWLPAFPSARPWACSWACLLACLMACGDSGRAESGSASAATQPTGATQGTSDGASETGGVPTTSEGTSEATSASSSGVGETSGETSDASSSGDPSLGTTTGFATTGFGDCEKALQATIRDFKAEHPDFEDFTSDLGQKGIVLPALGPDNKPVYAAPGPTAQTAGPGPFAQWYNNTPDTNIPFAIEIPLTEVMPGVFSFESNAFFPIDNEGWGNEGNPHNFHFTTEIHTVFNYKGGEVFTFIGDDDLWLFINGKLAIDLGGVHPQLEASVDLDAQADALGIQVGGMYTMAIFHAERHTDMSNFRIDTSIECFTIPG